MDRQCTPDDDHKDDPCPVSDVHPDEQVRDGDGTDGDSRPKLPDAEVVAMDRVCRRVGVDEVGDEEAHDRLVESVEHEPEEDGSAVLDPLDASLVELRECLRRRRADVLVELDTHSQFSSSYGRERLTMPRTATGSEVKTKLKSMMSE